MPSSFSIGVVMIAAFSLMERRSSIDSIAFFSSTISVRLMIIAPAYCTWLSKNSPKFLIYILHFFASATAIRSLIQNPGGEHSEAIPDINNPVRNPDTKTANILSSQIPPDAFYVFKKALDSGEFLTENSLDSILSYCLMKENVESLSSYMDVSEDLARRIINQQNFLLSFSQSVSVLKTRELTQTRIQRALLHIILNIHTAPTQIPFARVLGFRKESSELLSRIKQHSRIPLITKLADAQNLLDSEGNQILSETVFSSNLYEKLLCLKTGRKFCHESQKQLIIL